MQIKINKPKVKSVPNKTGILSNRRKTFDPTLPDATYLTMSVHAAVSVVNMSQSSAF